MKTFRYDLITKFYFRYANLALSFILLAYFIILILNAGNQPFLIVPALLDILIIYTINKYFIRTYKTLPFNINIDDEKISASNFMFGKEVIEINFSDIDGISGGVFGLNRKGLIYIHDGEKSRSISIHPKIENVDLLIKMILNKVNKELRDESIKKLRHWEENN
jgi:hypothetical protein